jgi:hypothetical protein
MRAVEGKLVRMKKIPRWLFPLGLAAAGLGAAGTVILRGCWHRNLSWPIRHGDYAYQVCNDCGVVRLFDEKAFRPYGPYGYNVDELIAIERAKHMRRIKEAEQRKTAAVQK